MAAIFLIGFVAASYHYYVAPQPPSLRILHANSEQMLEEIVDEFKEWYGHQVRVELVAVDPQTAYKRVTNPFQKPEAEIWWGGPLSLFREALSSLLPYNSTNKMNTTTYHFCPLMDFQDSTPRWYAASLHGLGVMYNQRVLESLGLSIPKNWEEIVNIEEYEENVTMVDPIGSEYSSPIIMLTLQSQNWTNGWEYLLQLSAFLKDFDDNEAKSASKVASGYLPIAILPDFYAYEKMAIPVSDINFTYLDATVLQPDPIAIIRKGTYPKEAKAFIDFILTQQAQNIIGKYRLPVREDATATPPRVNPFDNTFPHVLNYNETFEEIGKEMVNDYFEAWIADRHQEIRTAWKELQQANKTSPAYQLAWDNFTLVGHYIERAEIDQIYEETNGWTRIENVTSYINEWEAASTQAYKDAIENAIKSK